MMTDDTYHIVYIALSIKLFETRTKKWKLLKLRLANNFTPTQKSGKLSDILYALSG